MDNSEPKNIALESTQNYPESNRNFFSFFRTHKIWGFITFVVLFNIFLLIGIYLYNLVPPKQDVSVSVIVTPSVAQLPIKENSGFFSNQFAQSNNTKRRADVSAILNAVGQYQVENNGNAPSAISESKKLISKKGADICSDLVTTYLAAIPRDPLSIPNGNPVEDCHTQYDTNYLIQKDSDGKITVTAPYTELGEKISVTR